MKEKANPSSALPTGAGETPALRWVNSIFSRFQAPEQCKASKSRKLSMNLPGHRIAVCFGKAALKTHALQTLRDCRASPNSAKRLECVRFIGAFRPALDGQRFMVPCTVARPSGLSMNHASQIRMTNDEIRRNDEIRMTKPAVATTRAFRHSGFGFLLSFVIRHLSFNDSGSWSQCSRAITGKHTHAT